ncbi:uncharacterized protein [Parasteatoda tepidariorum]|uniref:uncharacterized protein n=1 Tax=Parasteatoda tepidariorum TaxID=114398 RepID=UPI0039BD7E7B
MDIKEVTLFSDSTIALAWINSSPHQLKTFVGNRVSKIQTLSNNFHWRHIPSEENPADLISRGIDPSELVSLDLWFSGPSNLDIQPTDQQSIEILNSELYELELKKSSNITLTLSSNSDFVNSFLTLSNNFVKLIRILSYIYRFISNCRKQERMFGPITREELQHAKLSLVKLVQVIVFRKEIHALKNKKRLKDSHVSNLNPFLDSNGLVRVGGRINNSNLSYDQKHPLLIPRDHKITTLIFQYFHLKNLHVGAQTLLHCVRQEFWPLNGRNTARKIVHDCITCFKAKPKIEQQIMASLPKERVTISPPFSKTGAA